MKTLKKILSIILMVSLLVVGLPLRTIKASDAVPANEITITSFVCHPMEIVQNTNGYTSSSSTGAYYHYSVNPTFDVTFSDGTTFTNQKYGVEYGGRYYSVYAATNQSESAPWGLGTRTVTAYMNGVTTEFEVSIIETPIKNITVDKVEIVDGTNRSRRTMYDSETGEYREYYYYYYYPDYTIEFKDGTSQRVEYGGSFEYNGESYHVSTDDDQSYDNEWGIGVHSATMSVLGYETSFEVEIVKSPVESITVKPLTIVEGTNGYYTTGYDANDNYVYYFNYYLDTFSFDISFSDGTVLKNQRRGFEYKGEHYYISVEIEQNAENPLTLGQHTVTARLGSLSATSYVTIVESPIVDVDVYDIRVFENDDGWSRLQPSRVDVTFEDGSVQVVTGELFTYRGNEYSLYFTEETNGENPWSIGNHTGTVWVGGVEKAFNYYVVSSEVSEIEAIKVQKIYEEEYSHISYGMEGEMHYIYDIPEFVLKVTKTDGTSYLEYGVPEYYEDDDKFYMLADSELGGTIGTSSEQRNQPWTVGANNIFTVSYAGLETSVSVEILPGAKEETASEVSWEYYEEDGGIYITGAKKLGTKVEIPEEIDGKPVVGVLSLGNDSNRMKELEIPDSVIILSESFLANEYLSNDIEKITIGSGVTYISANMFLDNYAFGSMREIIVSEDNPYYCTEDNVLYDKNKETIVFYPIGRGQEYTVPASVTNIDVMFDGLCRFVALSFEDESKEFIEENGIIYSADKKILISCNTNKAGEFIVPDGVETIGNEAFSRCDEITSITLPNSVIRISYGAFDNCTSLSRLELSDNLSYMGELVFNGCTELKTIELPSSLEEIGRRSFMHSYVEHLDVPNSVKSIGPYAFAYSRIKTILLGANLEKIEKQAFYRSSITEINIPDCVTFLGREAFYECKSLTNVTLGTGISFISDFCFAQCVNLKTVNLKNSHVKLGHKAFMDSGLESINMECIAELGYCAFDGTNITSVTLQDGVTKITYGAFTNCANLETIEIADSVTSINSNSFWGTAWYGKQDAGEVYIDHILYAYKGLAAEGTEIQVSEGTKVIADNAFAYQDGITSIQLNEGIEVIGMGAFLGGSGLTEIHIPASVKNIGEFAFAECNNLTSIYVDEANEYYSSNNGVLYNKEGTELIWCPRQSSEVFVVPETVELIKTGAFGSSTVSVVEVSNPDTTLEFGAVGYKCIKTDPEIVLQKNEAILKCYQNSNAYEYAQDSLYDVEIKEAQVSDMKIETLPTKTAYELGEELDLTGLSVRVSYSDQTNNVISEGFEVTGFDSMKLGTQTLTVTFDDKSATFDITMAGAQIIGDSVRGAVGSIVQVPIRMVGNKGVNYLSLKVAYDSSVLELLSAENTGLLDGMFQTSQYTTVNPYTMIWAGLAKNDADGELVVLTFKILDTAAEGEYPLQISCTEAYDLDYENVFFAVSDATVIVKNYVVGDVNDDGEINGKDVTILLKKLADWEIDINEAAADVNADGEINGKDVTLLMKYLAEWDVTLG